MKSQTLALSAITVMLALTLFVAGCTSSSPGVTNVPPVTTVTTVTILPAVTTLPIVTISTTATIVTIISPETTATIAGESSCGITTCHGLELACGKNAPQVCTMEYRLGDKCRQYAECITGSSGSCTLVTSPQFASCKSCVETCGNTTVNDPQKAFACEEKC